MRRRNEGKTARRKHQSHGNRSDELLHCESSGFWAIEAMNAEFRRETGFQQHPRGGRGLRQAKRKLEGAQLADTNWQID
jgi:hypothetical protein